LALEKTLQTLGFSDSEIFAKSELIKIAWSFFEIRAFGQAEIIVSELLDYSYNIESTEAKNKEGLLQFLSQFQNRLYNKH
jgi:hypothetical protein